MSSRPSKRRAPRPFRGLWLEQLESRDAPAVLSFNAILGNGLDDMVLRKNGNKIELLDNNILVASQSASSLSGIVITGASGEDDRLTVDFAFGGVFAPKNGISFNNATTAGGTDSLVINGTPQADAVGITATQVTLNNSAVTYSGLELLRVNVLAGNDAVTVTGLNPSTPTTVDAGPVADFETFSLQIAGAFNGNLTALHFDDVRGHVTGDWGGQWSVQGSGTIEDLQIGGSITPSGTVMAEDITQIAVVANLAGSVTVNDTADSTGSVQQISVGGDVTGEVAVDASLDTMTINGSSTGTIAAGDIGTVSASGGIAGSPVLNITENGVQRTLVATRTDNGQPTPSSVKFKYYYDSTGSGDPQLSIRVTNGDPTTSADDVPFDLSLRTSTAGKFNLARLFSVGTSGLRSLSVEGDVLATVSQAALDFFGLPAGTPGGVRLPGDALVGVAAQGDFAAGTLQAASVQMVAFGSVTGPGGTVLAESATQNDALTVLAPGTATVTANGTIRVPFAEGRPVALFIDSGPSAFDVKNVLFTDQRPDGASIAATVAVAGGALTGIALDGAGGSLATHLPVTGPITSNGPLGDLSLTSSAGIGDVTAPSIFGNIDTNGPIHGTIQTTAGDLGSVITDSSGNIIGVTTINTSQGITGRIISRGNLVSRISSQKELTGVIAAQGDIGVAVVTPTGQLVRFGGLLSNGQLTGTVVALGNIFGDINAKNGVAGRIAARGRPVAGLDTSRVGILGNINVSGSIDTTAAIVSGGVIGDLAGGTTFSSGSVKGILAAKGDINFGNVGNTTLAAIFENATGMNAAAIDAIFTDGGQRLGLDINALDLAGLGLILTDLGNLHVDPATGNLTGTVS
jgi:hypothetical protein